MAAIGRVIQMSRFRIALAGRMRAYSIELLPREGVFETAERPGCERSGFFMSLNSLISIEHLENSLGIGTRAKSYGCHAIDIGDLGQVGSARVWQLFDEITGGECGLDT